ASVALSDPPAARKNQPQVNQRQEMHQDPTVFGCRELLERPKELVFDLPFVIEAVVELSRSGLAGGIGRLLGSRGCNGLCGSFPRLTSSGNPAVAKRPLEPTARPVDPMNESRADPLLLRRAGQRLQVAGEFQRPSVQRLENVEPSP